MFSFSPRALGVICLVTTSVGWGLNWPAVKYLVREWPPMFTRGVAGVTAAALIAALAVLLGQRLAVPRQSIPRLAVAALTNVFGWMGLSSIAIRWLSAGQTALLVYTMPVWATLLAWPLLGTRPSRRAVAGLALCIAGIGLLFGGQELSIGPDKLAGALLALCAAVSFAFGTVALKPLELPPLTVLTWQVGLGCVPMVLFGFAFEHPDLGALSAVGWSIMAYMTVIPMGLCYLTWFAALRRLPPATASVATLLTPMVGTVAAAAILGEPFGVRQLLALGLTLSGVVLVLRKKRPTD